MPHASISEYYSNPQLYDQLNSYRDVGSECDFVLRECSRRSGRPPKVVYEMACGPGYHSIFLARRGFSVIAIDREPRMVEYARTRAARESLPATFHVGDFRRYRLERRVDLAITMRFSLGYVLSSEDLLEHFRVVAHQLNRKGLYIFDLHHPSELFGKWNSTPQFYRDGPDLLEMYWGEAPADLVINPITQQVRVTARLKQNGRLVREFTSVEKIWLPAELHCVVKLSGVFEVAGIYGAFSTRVGLSRPAARKMVVVLRKA